MDLKCPERIPMLGLTPVFSMGVSVHAQYGQSFQTGVGKNRKNFLGGRSQNRRVVTNTSPATRGQRAYKNAQIVLCVMVSDEWVVGLVDGEGCFNISVQRNIDRHLRKTNRIYILKVKHKAMGVRVVPSFRIVLRQDDQNTLELVKQKLGVGAIYINAGGTKKNPNASPAAHYYVQTHADLKKVADFFRLHPLQSKKRKDFELWCQGLEIIFQKRHLTPEGMMELCKLREQMNSRASKGNRTTTEITSLLSAPTRPGAEKALSYT